MTLKFECDMGDYSGGEDLIKDFDVTEERGISAQSLKNAELAAARSLFGHHRHSHPGHSATSSFSIPEGYVNRGGMIYKASPKKPA